MGSMGEPTVDAHHFHYLPQFNTQAATAAISECSSNLSGDRSTSAEWQHRTAELYSIMSMGDGNFP